MRTAHSQHWALALLAAVGLGASVLAGPALAADTDEVGEALAALGVTDAPPGLVEDIWTLLPEELSLEPLNGNEVAERITARVRNWQILAPEWREVPAAVMAQVRECRDAPDPEARGEECGEQLQIRLRIEHAERLVARFTERLAEAEGLPEQARAEVIAALKLVRERVQQRLDDLMADTGATVEDALEAIGIDRALLARVRAQVAEQVGELQRRNEDSPGPPSTQGGPASTQPGPTGSGRSGGNTEQGGNGR